MPVFSTVLLLESFVTRPLSIMYWSCMSLMVMVALYVLPLYVTSHTNSATPSTMASVTERVACVPRVVFGSPNLYHLNVTPLPATATAVPLCSSDAARVMVSLLVLMTWSLPPALLVALITTL